jgi:hypothetical protein
MSDLRLKCAAYLALVGRVVLIQFCEYCIREADGDML